MPPNNMENEPFHESSPRTLPFVIGFYFAFRIFTVLISVRILGMEPQTGTAINLALNFLLVLIVGFCSLGHVRYPLGQMAQLSAVRWAFIFLGFSSCSLLWSSTASMPVSIVYWCGMAADVAIVVLLLRSRPILSVSDSLMKGFIWGACTGAIIIWFFPAQSDLRLGDEELLGPNNIGYLCGLAFFFAQYLMRRRSGKWGLPALLLVVTLVRCLSKTTIVALLVSEAFLLIRDNSIKPRKKIFLVIAAGVMIAAFSALLTSYYDIYTNAGNQSETLSGRLGIWAYFLTEAVQQPWIGHGFDSVWKVVPTFGPDQFEAPHAHNELLQQFYTYGLVGICIFVGIYSSLYLQIRRLTANPLRTFFLAFLLFVLVRGTADTERFDLSLPLWTIVLISIILDYETNPHREIAIAPFTSS